MSVRKRGGVDEPGPGTPASPAEAGGRRPGSLVSTHVLVVDEGVPSRRWDSLATEEPLEIRVWAGSERRTVAVTMRTPGADFELAVGFLCAEGVVVDRRQIRRISYCTDPDVGAEQQYNVVTVRLDAASGPDLAPLERHFTITSACGVCGKASLDALRLRGCPSVPPGPGVSFDVLRTLPGRLQDSQGIFRRTGGLHAAALFSSGGELVALREDVGRHNAVDKLIGWAVLEGRLPLGESLLVVSGRSSFEILQKSLVAGIPVVCSVSAPSSLAVALAREFGLTLVGFLRGGRFNVYSGDERIVLPVADPGPATGGR